MIDPKQEREILDQLQLLARQRDALLAALPQATGAAARDLALQLKDLQARMTPGFERLHTAYSPRLRRQASHLARSAADAEEIEQEGWRRFLQSLASFDSSKLFLPWLGACVRNAATDFYRASHQRRGVLTGDDVIALLLDHAAASRAAHTSAPPGALPDPRFFLALLAAAMGPKAGPVHERLTFGFARLLSEKPRHLVADHSGHSLRAMTDQLIADYAASAVMPPAVIAGAFAALLATLPRRLRDTDPVTANKFLHSLADLPVGEGLYRQYLPANPEHAVGRWADNVRDHLLNSPEVRSAQRMRGEARPWA